MNHSNRQLHGALLDAELLAFVYLAMTGGQANLLIEDTQEQSLMVSRGQQVDNLTSNSPVVNATTDELEAHELFVQYIKKKSGIDLFNRM